MSISRALLHKMYGEFNPLAFGFSTEYGPYLVAQLEAGALIEKVLADALFVGDLTDYLIYAASLPLLRPRSVLRLDAYKPSIDEPIDGAKGPSLADIIDKSITETFLAGVFYGEEDLGPLVVGIDTLFVIPGALTNPDDADEDVAETIRDAGPFALNVPWEEIFETEEAGDELVRQAFLQVVAWAIENDEKTLSVLIHDSEDGFSGTELFGIPVTVTGRYVSEDETPFLVITFDIEDLDVEALLDEVEEDEDDDEDEDDEEDDEEEVVLAIVHLEVSLITLSLATDEANANQTPQPENAGEGEQPAVQTDLGGDKEPVIEPANE